MAIQINTMRQTIINVTSNGGQFTVHKYRYRDDALRKLLRRMVKSGIIKRSPYPDNKYLAYVKCEEKDEQ